MLTDEKIKQVIVEAAGRMNLYAFSDVVYIAHCIESAVREECAQVCEKIYTKHGDPWQCSDAIRKGGQK